MGAFSGLSERLSHIFSKLKDKGKLTELEVKGAMREVRIALLEADVNLSVRASGGAAGKGDEDGILVIDLLHKKPGILSEIELFPPVGEYQFRLFPEETALCIR